MHKPLEIDFRDIPPSAGLTAAIRKRVGKLEQRYEPIVHCRVTVGASAERDHPGTQYAAHIRLSLPGREFVASQEHGGRRPEDSYVAVGAAFDAVQRQLEDYRRAS